MKKIAHSIIIIILLASTAPSQQREVPPVKLKKIAENLYEILGGRGAQGGVFIGDNGAVVIDAERFCSGHSEIIDRSAIRQQIEQMKARQEKVRQLIGKGMNLDQIKGEFQENESRLIESIFNEIKDGL